MSTARPFSFRCAKNLAFRLQDPLPAAQILNMSVTNVGDHGDIRAHHGTQILDLSEMVHSRFDHRRLMLRGKTQQRQRRSNVIVEILRRFQNVQLRPQYRGDHLFRGSFSHAAGDLHKGNVEPIPVSGSQIPQSQPGVRHLDIKFVRADILGQRAHRQPAAPASSAASINWWPSNFSPTQGRNRQPGVIFRLSVETALTVGI